MKYFDLFSGIGGFHLGMQQAGHECVGACEIDKYARQVYGKHFPDVTIWEDATKLDPAKIPDFECLVAGFPCQAFSIAGRRLGFEESRGTLFFEIVRIARQKRPRLLLLENVKGLLSHDRGKTFANILAALDECGYDAEWQVLNSKYFVPQNRERIYIIGYLRDKSRPKIFPLRTSNQINDSTCRQTQEKRQRLRDTYTMAIDANYSKGASSRTMIAWSKSHRTGKTKADKRRHNYGKIESRLKFGEANALNTGDGCRNQSTMSFIKEDTRVRKLTPLECERLQGFPDNWTAILSDTQRYKCCGNAVTVPVVRYIAEHLVL